MEQDGTLRGSPRSMDWTPGEPPRLPNRLSPGPPKAGRRASIPFMLSDPAPPLPREWASWGRWTAWAAGIVLVLVVLGFGLRWTATGTFLCPACGTRSDVQAWGFGASGTPWSHEAGRTGSLRTSRTLQELFLGTCAHTWPAEYAAQTRFLRRTEIPYCGAVTNPFPAAYETSARLRGVVKVKLDAGTLALADLRALCLVDASGMKDHKARAPADLLALGCDLLKEAGETIPPPWLPPAAKAGAKR